MTKRFTYDIMLYMEYITTISSKGQITVPAKIRRQLNIHPGDRLKVVKKDKAISITPDTYQEELDALRKRAEAQMKKNGTWGISWEEARELADEARLKEYAKKYGIRT